MPSPFYKLGLQKEDLTFELQEVVIGPTPHLERSRAAVQALLINKSVWRSKERREHVPIIGTEVPYRNW
jgi:hypothetical protein